MKKNQPGYIKGFFTSSLVKASSVTMLAVFGVSYIVYGIAAPNPKLTDTLPETGKTPTDDYTMEFLYLNGEHVYNPYTLTTKGCIGGSNGQDYTTTHGFVISGDRQYDIAIEGAMRTVITGTTDHNILPYFQPCQAAGFYQNDYYGGDFFGFYWANGKITMIPPLPATKTKNRIERPASSIQNKYPQFISSIPGTSTQAININGQVVGVSNNRAFLWSKTTGTQDLNTYLSSLGAVASDAYGINDAGTIVGNYTNSSGIVRGYMLTPAKTGYSAIDLGTPEGFDSLYVMGVNSLNHIYGASYDSLWGIYMPFVWVDGNFYDINDTIVQNNWWNVWIGGMNDSDEFVISYVDPIDGVPHPALVRDITTTPQVITLDQYFTTPEFHSGNATDINNDGDIIGFGLDNADPQNQQIWGWILMKQ